MFGYLHGETGPYEGLVNGFDKNRVIGGERISTKYFDFRFYQGTGTIHFYPASEAVVEKINRFVGKIRNWIPGDMTEANQDFQKQYENGESLTKEYLDHYKKSGRHSYGRDNPAYQLLRETKGVESDRGELDRLEKAIESVHQDKGLHCGPALTGSAPVKAITSNQRAPSAAHQEQMLLLAA